MNIILIGFMASGKSSTGKYLADKLGYKFTDTDTLIEQKAGMSIKDIFNTKGEAVFRDLESAMCKSLTSLDKCVVATGGGIVGRPENRKALKKAGKVIYLKVTAEDVMTRVKDYTTRPLINYPDPDQRRAVIAELLEKRENWYMETADLVIDTATGNIDQDAGLILKQIKLGAS